MNRDRAQLCTACDDGSGDIRWFRLADIHTDALPHAERGEGDAGDAGSDTQQQQQTDDGGRHADG